MIVNVRGNSGSGKSHLVRSLMDLTSFEQFFVDGRRRPMGYRLDFDRPLTILGHYETPCGGCDTLGSFNEIFRWVRAEAERGRDVLFEGLLISEESRRTIELSRNFEVVVALIDMLPEECLSWINLRRRERNPEAIDVDPKNTVARWRRIEGAFRKLDAAGVTCARGNRDVVAEKIEGWVRCA